MKDFLSAEITMTMGEMFNIISFHIFIIVAVLGVFFDIISLKYFINRTNILFLKYILALIQGVLYGIGMAFLFFYGIMFIRMLVMGIGEILNYLLNFIVYGF